MAKEFDIKTNIGNIPSRNEFQRVKQTSVSGKTGDEITETNNGKVYAIVDSVKGIFAEHSEKLFSVIALVGFTFVFYAGNIKNWDDFFRYSAFLGVVLIFYLILLLGRWLKDDSNKEI